jgi:DNA invertase Pin-like site-specific DNA recombinase
MAGRLMLTVLSGIAEFERSLILQRLTKAALAPWPKAYDLAGSRS